MSLSLDTQKIFIGVTWRWRLWHSSGHVFYFYYIWNKYRGRSSHIDFSWFNLQRLFEWLQHLDQTLFKLWRLQKHMGKETSVNKMALDGGKKHTDVIWFDLIVHVTWLLGHLWLRQGLVSYFLLTRLVIPSLSTTQSSFSASLLTSKCVRNNQLKLTDTYHKLCIHYNVIIFMQG